MATDVGLASSDMASSAALVASLVAFLNVSATVFFARSNAALISSDVTNEEKIFFRFKSVKVELVGRDMFGTESDD